MSKNDLSLLRDRLRDEDHFDMIKELGEELKKASETLIEFHGTLTHIAECRKELPPALAKADVLIEVIRWKLSIMAGEWNEVKEKTINDMINERVDFNTMEF